MIFTHWKKICLASLALLSGATLLNAIRQPASAAPSDASTRIEGSFVIEKLDGDPFDSLAHDVRVQLRGDSRVLAVPKDEDAVIAIVKRKGAAFQTRRAAKK